ncbi:AEC family transporter [Dongia sp.]|uniref:AEC family transporter n=1 Tax=Dongia sp. TaxID=1977262 RepID=UPI003750701B
MLGQLAAVILPVVVIAGIGYTWSRLKRPFDNALVTQLVSMIGSPCLVASSLTSLHVEPESLGIMALATILVFSGMFVLGFAVLRYMNLPMHSYLPAVVFSNAGNMGLPLALFAFGDSGLALAVVYFAFSATLQFTAGMSIAAGTASVKHLVKMPVIYAVGASFLVIVTGIQVPDFIANTLEILGGLTIPLMLLALGVSLGSLRVRSLPRNLFLSLVRMLGGFAISFLVAWALDLSPMARGVLLIQASMPVAVFNYLFAQYYNRRPEDVAAMVIISTLLSFGTLPFLIYYVLATAH